MASLTSAKPSKTKASLGICSPADRRITSPNTNSSGLRATSWPSRMVLTFSLVMRLSLSTMCLARSSVTIPEKALKQITAKKTRLLQACTKARAKAMAKFKALKRVKTFRLMICQVLVLADAVKSLTKPLTCLSLTSLWVNPIILFLSINSIISFFLKKF